MNGVDACKLARLWARQHALTKRPPCHDSTLHMVLKNNGVRWNRTRVKAIEAYRKTYTITAKRVRRKAA